MSDRAKNFIFNGLTYGLVFFFISLILGYCFNFPLNKTLLSAVPIGLFAFVMYGLIQSRFTTTMKTLEAITISNEVAENIKLESPANHMVNDHIVSGKLFITDKKLVFIDCSKQEIFWSLYQLQTSKFHFSIFNLGGQFVLVDENKNSLVFEVDNIRLWKGTLQGLIGDNK